MISWPISLPGKHAVTTMARIHTISYQKGKMTLLELPNRYSDLLSCMFQHLLQGTCFTRSQFIFNLFVLFLELILLCDIFYGNLNKCQLRQKCQLQIENQRWPYGSLIWQTNEFIVLTYRKEYVNGITCRIMGGKSSHITYKHNPELVVNHENCIHGTLWISSSATGRVSLLLSN